MGGITRAVGKLVDAVTGGLIGGGAKQNIKIPEPQAPAAVAASTPEAIPEEQRAGSNRKRKKTGKASLTIPTSDNTNSGGGLNI